MADDLLASAWTRGWGLRCRSIAKVDHDRLCFHNINSPAPVPIEEITLTLVNINQSDFDDNGLPYVNPLSCRSIDQIELSRDCTE